MDAEVDIKLGDIGQIDNLNDLDDLKLDFGDIPDLESDNIKLGDLEDFAVGNVTKIELPKPTPGLSLALAVDSKEGVIKVAEVPCEVVQTGGCKNK